MPRLPQCVSFLGSDCKLQRTSAMAFTNKTNQFELIGNARFRAVKFKEQHRLFDEAQPALMVACTDCGFVEQLHPRYRYR